MRGIDRILGKYEDQHAEEVDGLYNRGGIGVACAHVARGDPALDRVLLQGRNDRIGDGRILRGVADEYVSAGGGLELWSLVFGHTGSCRPCAVRARVGSPANIGRRKYAPVRR